MSFLGPVGPRTNPRIPLDDFVRWTFIIIFNYYLNNDSQTRMIYCRSVFVNHEYVRFVCVSVLIFPFTNLTLRFTKCNKSVSCVIRINVLFPIIY